MWESWKDQKPKYNDIKKWWDLGKIKIKRFTQEYSTEQSLKSKLVLEEVENKIDDLKKDFTKQEELNRLKQEYENIVSKANEGAKIRSRVQWWEEGEKSTKYFHNLEKRKAKDKMWDKILDKDQNILYGTNEIQNSNSLVRQCSVIITYGAALWTKYSGTSSFNSRTIYKW